MTRTLPVLKIELYLLFRKTSRGITVGSYMRKPPPTKSNEVMMKLNVAIPGEMFEKPIVECKIELPSHRMNDISTNQVEIEKSISRIIGKDIKMTVTEVAT